jgi:hypothetical protein
VKREARVMRRDLQIRLRRMLSSWRHFDKSSFLSQNLLIDVAAFVLPFGESVFVLRVLCFYA